MRTCNFVCVFVCLFEMVRKNLDEHLDSCFENHYSMVLEALVGLQGAFTDREAQLTAKVEALTERVGRAVAIHADAFIWHIDDWSDVYAKARSGRTTSINGPCVTTGALGRGYRISLTVHPYGDGIGKYIVIGL